MASSPLPYATYQSGHRREQSAASVNDDKIVSRAGRSTEQDAGASGSSSTSSYNDKTSTSLQRPSFSISQSRPSPLANDVNGIARAIRPASNAAAPPPLRTISSIRSTSSANGRPNGKGKEISDGARIIGQRAMQAQSSSSLTPLDQARRSVLSSLAIPASSSFPEVIEDPKLEKPLSQRINGHFKRHSYSPSTNPLASSHSRSASSNLSTPHMPHLISTAQRLRSTNASNTPTTSLSANSSPSGTPRVMSPSLEAMNINARGTQLPSSVSLDGIGRRTAYRPGFQPKGVHRVRTDEFIAARDRRKGVMTSSAMSHSNEDAPSRGELEAQRLERRLEKLVSLYYESTPISIDTMPSWLPNTLRKTRQLAEEEKRIREEEMRIVKWEEDSTRKVCPICNTPFSISIRKHHCRLCGRIICASPHLSTPRGLDAEKTPILELSYSEEQKCSTLMTSDSKKGSILKDLPRWDPRDGGATFDHLGQNGKRGIRICRNCRETILNRQYMLDDGKAPAYLRLYEGLVSLQRDIEQSLPEFQEMVLGLQKQDAAAALGTTETFNNDILSSSSSHNEASSNASLAALKARNRNTLALQRDAAQARKQLLTNFANYDLYAKKIRNLDDQGNVSLTRIKGAIWTKANLFLQQNMFPLQSLPKLMEKKEKKSSSSGTQTPTSSTSGGNASDAEVRPFQSILNEVNSSTSVDVKADARALQLVQTDPQAAKESLVVLEQQLSLVLEYAASASRARKFQDAASLKASAIDLQGEIDRLRKLGISSSSSTSSTITRR